MAELGPAGVTLVAFIASILGLVGLFGATGVASRDDFSGDADRRR